MQATLPRSKHLGFVQAMVEQKGSRRADNSGCFKRVWKVHGRKRAYALKKGCMDEGTFSQRSWGNGTEDLRRELLVWHTAHYPRALLVPYIAWGVVRGRFYAIQPWGGELETDSDGEVDGINGYDKLDFTINDMHSGNACMYKGQARAIDYGYHNGMRLTVTYAAPNTMKLKVKGHYE